jgi:hypothetical protein
MLAPATPCCAGKRCLGLFRYFRAGQWGWLTVEDDWTA